MKQTLFKVFFQMTCFTLIVSILSFGYSVGILPVNAETVEASVFYETDFENSNLNEVPEDWNPVWSGYKFSVIMDGDNKVYFSDNASVGLAKSVIRDKIWNDCRLEAKVKFDSIAGRIGLVARYIDGNNFYYFHYDAGNNAVLGLRSSGTMKTIAQAKIVPLSANQYHTLGIQVQGNQLTGYVDGKVVLTGQDDTIQEGSFGILTHLQKAYFDDVRVLQPYSEPVPDPLIEKVDITDMDPDKLPEDVLPPVFEPVADGFRLDIPDVLGNQELAALGLVDVTAAPFYADPTGAADSTDALQQAINFARDAQMVCWISEGTYMISDTLVLRQGMMVRSNWNLIMSHAELPCILIGSTKGERPNFVLAPNSKGFNDPMNPKYMIDYQVPTITRDKDNPKLFIIDKGKQQYNVLMNGMIRDLDFEIGEGNAGAVGIHMSSAEFSAIQNVTINAANGYCGISGGAGNGGSWTNIKVIGGEIGLDLRVYTVPTPVMEGVTLINQKKSAILSACRGSLTIVGLKVYSEANGPLIGVEVKGSPFDSTLNIIDSEFVFNNTENTDESRKAIASPVKSVYLDNVYVKNADEVVENQLEGNENGWFFVKEFAFGVDVNYSGQQFKAPVYIDGEQQGNRLEQSETGIAPPDDLQSRHLAGVNIPGFETEGAVNVKDAPYNASGDGYTDDTTALQKAINENEIVFLPKGYYCVTKTIKLRPNTKLIGVAANLSVIFVRDPEGYFGNSNNPRPIVETANNKDAETVIANFRILTPFEVKQDFKGENIPVYALKWQSGRKSVVQTVSIAPQRIYGFITNPDYKEIPFKHPFALITGNGGGKWYNFQSGIAWAQIADEMRNVLIKNTREPLYFYNTEIQGECPENTFEIRNSKYVTIYGSKTEGTTVYLSVKDSDHIRVFGHGGNGSGKEGGPLFRFENTPNFLVSNISDQLNMGETIVFRNDWKYLNYKEYYPLEEQNGAETVIVPYDERPVLYKRGNPVPEEDIQGRPNNRYMSLGVKPIQVNNRVW